MGVTTRRSRCGRESTAEMFDSRHVGIHCDLTWVDYIARNAVQNAIIAIEARPKQIADKDDIFNIEEYLEYNRGNLDCINGRVKEIDVRL